MRSNQRISHRWASNVFAPLSNSRSAKSRVRSASQGYILANAQNTSKGPVGNSPFGIGPAEEFCLRLCCATTLFDVSRWRTRSRTARAPMLHRCGARRDRILFRMATCGISLFTESAFPWSVDADRLWSSGLICVLRPVSSPKHERYRDRDCSPVHGLLCLPWTRSILDRRPAVWTTYARIHRLLRTRKVAGRARPKQSSSAPGHSQRVRAPPATNTEFVPINALVAQCSVRCARAASTVRGDRRAAGRDCIWMESPRVRSSLRPGPRWHRHRSPCP